MIALQLSILAIPLTINGESRLVKKFVLGNIWMHLIGYWVDPWNRNSLLVSRTVVWYHLYMSKRQCLSMLNASSSFSIFLLHAFTLKSLVRLCSPLIFFTNITSKFLFLLACDHNHSPVIQVLRSDPIVAYRPLVTLVMYIKLFIIWILCLQGTFVNNILHMKEEVICCCLKKDDNLFVYIIINKI